MKQVQRMVRWFRKDKKRTVGNAITAQISMEYKSGEYSVMLNRQQQIIRQFRIAKNITVGTVKIAIVYNSTVQHNIL